MSNYPLSFCVKKYISLKYFSAFMALFIMLSVSACGGGGGGGSGGTGGGNGGGGSNEGSVDSVTGLITPKVISEGYTGTVSTGVSYYQVSGFSPSTKYYVYIHEVTNDVALTTSSSVYFFSWCSSDRSGTLSEVCDAISDASGNIFFKVSGGSTTDGASYKVSILSEPINEGSLAVPNAITGLLPYSGTVANSGSSYYEVGGLVAGQNYSVLLTNMLFTASLETYPHRNMYSSATTAPVCSSNSAGWDDESCIQTANFEGKIYIKVVDQSPGFDFEGSFFTISVTSVTGTGTTFEGYGDAPVELISLPYISSTFSFDSFYKASGLTPGQRYEVHFKNVSALDDGTGLSGAYIQAHPATDIGGSSCTKYASASFNTFSDWCVATASDSGNIYINVYSAYNKVTSYELDIATAPVAEGSVATPKAISMPYDGQVDDTNSYYIVSGLTPNWNYEVVHSNETRAVYLNTGSSTASLLSYSTGKTNALGELYIRVSSSSSDGSRFSLDLAAANNPEGSIASPVDISAATEGVPHSGQVDDTSSYYILTGLVPGKYYMTHMNGVVIGTGGITLYSNPAFDFASKICSVSGIYPEEEGTCLAPATASGELYVQIDAGWDITGSTYNIWTVESLISHEGLAGVPMDITGGINAGSTVTHAGQVTTFNNNASYYKLVLNSGPANYTVSLANMTGNVDLEVWNAITGSTDSCLSKRDHLLEESCVIQSETVGGAIKTVDLYIKVSVVNSYSDHWDGANFDLIVTPGGTLPVSEGTDVAPVDITGSLPYAGKTSSSALNYYKVTGLNPAMQYEISSSNDIYGMLTKVYDEVLSSATTTELCSARNIAPHLNETRKLACKAFPNATGELYITVSSDYWKTSSDSFSLNVTAAPVAEGTQSVPVVITGTGTRASQVNGSLDGSGNYTVDMVNSYYQVTGLTAGTMYMAQVSSDTEEVELNVYSDSGFSVAECSTDVWSSQCAFTANAAGEAYIHADGYIATTISGSFFDLSISEMPVAEGSVASPVVLTAGVVHRGQQGGYQNNSYYKLSGLLPNSTHRLLIKNKTGETAVYLYGESSMSYYNCEIYQADEPDGCSVGANAAGEIFIRTQSNSVGEDAATYYDLYVTP